MTILAQNGNIWNPRLNTKKKKMISRRAAGYLLLAAVFAAPSLLATLNLMPFIGKHVFHIENNQLVQTALSTNWLTTAGIFLSALVSVFFVNVALKTKTDDIRAIVISVPILMALFMVPLIVNLDRSADIDANNVSSWIQKETNSSVKVSGTSFIYSKIITTEKGKSYLLTSTGDDKKKTFALKEIETKG
jgi:hypothetical protein